MTGSIVCDGVFFNLTFNNNCEYHYCNRNRHNDALPINVLFLRDTLWLNAHTFAIGFSRVLFLIEHCGSTFVT